MPRIRTYGEMIAIEGYRERYEYLRINAKIGVDTFGFERWLNQAFYRSAEWKNVRTVVIARDYGCDLGVRGHEIHDKIIVHHMNPMNAHHLIHGDRQILDPEFLISVSHRTHNAIHFGDESLLTQPLVHRRPGDTKLW